MCGGRVDPPGDFTGGLGCSRAGRWRYFQSIIGGTQPMQWSEPSDDASRSRVDSVIQRCAVGLGGAESGSGLLYAAGP